MPLRGDFANLIRSDGVLNQNQYSQFLQAPSPAIPGLTGPRAGFPGLPNQQPMIPQQYPMFQGGLLSQLAQRMSGAQQQPAPSGLLGFAPKLQQLPTGIAGGRRFSNRGF